MSDNFNDIAAQAKRNLSLPGCHRFGEYLGDITFTRPSVSKGYGAVLSCLKYAGTPLSKAKIMKAIAPVDVALTSYPSVFIRLRAGKLIRATGRGYVLTQLGSDYVNAWLGQDVH